MTKPLPSLALDMSQDGIALHQLAFDGHWHELAQVSLNDAALRERLSNMRDIAARLGGRRCEVQIWLPKDQIFESTLAEPDPNIPGQLALARNQLARDFGDKPTDYAAEIGEANPENGSLAVAGVRLRTLHEAKTFAKSHGFKPRGFSTRAEVAGFSKAPVFSVPTDKAKAVGLGFVAAAAATLVIGGGYSFYQIDPFDFWEVPPKAADFAPFQQPNPGIERAGAPALPAGPNPGPVFPEFAGLFAPALPAALPYLPPRRLTADAQEEIQPSAPPVQSNPLDPIPEYIQVAVNWPAEISPLPDPAPADDQPELGLIPLLAKIETPTAPVPDAAPDRPAGPMPALLRQPRPMTVANTAFFLEPLPAMATRLSPDALAEFVARSGLTVAQLSRMASPILLIESRVVEYTRGLPPVLPALRSGRPIPPQVEPPAEPDVIPDATPAAPLVATGPAPLFSLVEGAPEIRPSFRPKPPAPAEPEAAIADPALENSTEIAAADPPAAPVVPDTTEADISVALAVDAAISTLEPRPEDAPFALIAGQPDLLPRLRSGAEIPERVFASISADLLAEGNRLRALRRPKPNIDIVTPENDTISAAAPTVAVRPSRRTAAFVASAAEMAATRTERPHATPVVPPDPQTVSLPTSASVARAATIQNAINLRRTNLLGIFGAADARTALIMLADGRRVRVQTGQKFTGWTVVAISENTVRIRKRNREAILRMPAE